ncbi:MAG: hypothetical protein ACRDTH_26340 [Pseudonocardiaceae bacterium]
MYITTKFDENNLNKFEHQCDVWNVNGGPSPAWKKVSCYHEALVPGGSRGGGKEDVDAFTYADRGYMLNFRGSQSWKDKGVWAKIQDNERADCYLNRRFGVPQCYVDWDL